MLNLLNFNHRYEILCYLIQNGIFIPKCHYLELMTRSAVHPTDVFATSLFSAVVMKMGMMRVHRNCGQNDKEKLHD